MTNTHLFIELLVNNQPLFNQTTNTYGLLVQRCTKAQQPSEHGSKDNYCRGPLSCTVFVHVKEFVVFLACHHGSPIRCGSPYPLLHSQAMHWRSMICLEWEKNKLIWARVLSLHVYTLSTSPIFFYSAFLNSLPWRIHHLTIRSNPVAAHKSCFMRVTLCSFSFLQCIE